MVMRVSMLWKLTLAFVLVAVTTAALVAVFMPIAFMQGIVGRMFQSFGLTMSFAIMVSLLVAFTLTPMLCSKWLRKPRPQAERGKILGEILEHHELRAPQRVAHQRFQPAQIQVLAGLARCRRLRLARDFGSRNASPPDLCRHLLPAVWRVTVAAPRDGYQL